MLTGSNVQMCSNPLDHTRRSLDAYASSGRIAPEETGEVMLCLLTASEFLEERMGPGHDWLEVNQTAFGAEFLAFWGEPIFAATVCSHLGRFLGWLREGRPALPALAARSLDRPLMGSQAVTAPGQVSALGDG